LLSVGIVDALQLDTILVKRTKNMVCNGGPNLQGGIMEDQIELAVPAPTSSNMLKLGKVIFSACVGFAATEGAGKVWDKVLTRIKNR